MKVGVEAVVMPEDVVSACNFLDGYNFYMNRGHVELANLYWDKLQGLLAKRREHDQLESLKKYAIKKGVTRIEHGGKTITIQFISIQRV